MIDVFNRLAGEVLTRDISILFISVGINDVLRIPDKNAPMSISIPTREEYWLKIFEVLKKLNIKIIINDILPTDETCSPSLFKQPDPIKWFNKDISTYNQYLENMCLRYKMPFSKRFDTWIQYPNIKELLIDAVHPTAKGHQMIAEHAFKELMNRGWLEKSNHLIIK